MSERPQLVIATPESLKELLRSGGFDELGETRFVIGLDSDNTWVVDPFTGEIFRPDGRFYVIRMVDRGNYLQPALIQEPAIEPDETGRRIVGQVIVQYRRAGMYFTTVRVRKANGLNGEILELMPSSISKGELAEQGMIPVGYFNADPQRLDGLIAVYKEEGNFPDEEGMTIEDFMTQSTDGRSLAAIGICGL